MSIDPWDDNSTQGEGDANEDSIEPDSASNASDDDAAGDGFGGGLKVQWDAAAGTLSVVSKRPRISPLPLLEVREAQEQLHDLISPDTGEVWCSDDEELAERLIRVVERGRGTQRLMTEFMF